MKKKILVSIIFLLAIAAMVAGSNDQFGDHEINLGNLTFNQTGMHAFGNKTSVRTADVVVCRGTSLIDDVIKSISCDVVCKSTDTDCESEIEDAIARDDVGTLVLRGDFPVEGAEINIPIDKSITIYGYNASIKKTVSNTGGKFINVGARSNLNLFGLTVDINNMSGAGVGTDLGSYETDILIRDCTFLNIYSYGVLQSGYDNDGSVVVNDTLVIENTKFYGGNPEIMGSMLNEPILTRATKTIRITGVESYGNKCVYLSSENVYIDNLLCDGTGSASVIHPIHGENILIQNMIVKDGSITLRPFGSVHMYTLHSPAKNVVVNGLYIYVNDTSTYSDSLYITPYNTTFGLENVNIENVYLEWGDIIVEPFTGKTTGKVDHLDISGFHSDNFNSNVDILYIVNTDIDSLRIIGAETPTYTGSGAYVRAYAKNRDITIDNVRIENADEARYLLRAFDDGSGRTVTFNMVPPIPTKSVGTIYPSGSVIVDMNYLPFYFSNTSYINGTSSAIDINGVIFSDETMQTGDTTWNESGVYNSGKSYVRAYDYIICPPGSSKPECDIVCGVGDCTEVQTALTERGNIKFMPGTYSFTTDWTVYSNTSIEGSEGTLLNVANTFNINSVANDDLENFELSSLNFVSTLPAVDQQPLINLSGLSSGENIRLNDLEITNWNCSYTIWVRTKLMAGGVMRDVVVENIRLYDTRGGISFIEKDSARVDKMQNIVVRNWYHDNANYYDEFYGEDAWGISFSGARNIEVSNVFFQKAADGQYVIIRRVNTGTISNIQSIDQHDYAVQVTDGSKNIRIDNVETVNCRHWGALMIDNTNLDTSNENIHASNIRVINCSHGSTEWAIGISQIKNGAPPMKNILIENFYINGSSSYGAIRVNSDKGEIHGVIIRDGTIENTNQAGIYITGRNMTRDLVIENVKFFDIAKTTGDNDKKSCIVSYNANVSRARIVNNVCSNETATGVGGITKFLRVLADGGNTHFDGTAYDNVVLGGISAKYSFYGANLGARNFEDYVFTGSVSAQECAINSINDGAEIYNSSHGGKCQAGTWKTWAVS